MKDITDRNDVILLVNAFYSKVRSDEILKDIFNDVIKDEWQPHLEKMYKFWETILLAQNTYTGNPFSPHAGLSIFKHHFDRWLKLFFETVDEYFYGEKANFAKEQAQKIAIIFLSKIEYIRKQSLQDEDV